MAKNQRGQNNNNPEGHNQYSNGWMESAKDKPFTAAAAAAAAVGAGVFLWSRRNQISDQISRLGDQISDWSDSMRSGDSQSDGEFEMADSMASTGASRSGSARTSGRTASSGSSGNSSRTSGSRGNGRTARGMSETGGGNASLGAHSGTTGTGAGA